MNDRWEEEHAFGAKPGHDDSAGEKAACEGNRPHKIINSNFARERGGRFAFASDSFEAGPGDADADGPHDHRRPVAANPFCAGEERDNERDNNYGPTAHQRRKIAAALRDLAAVKSASCVN